jgi:predicted nucleic acid-binding protein
LIPTRWSPAFCQPAGNEALIVLAIHQGLISPCLSEAIIAEYSAVLARPKSAFPPEEIDALLAMLQGKGEIFRPEESPVVSPDPADTALRNLLL